MNIQGLDYNTQREKLVLPEYGREIQKMVNYCMTLPDRDARLRCAYAIIDTMEQMNPQLTQTDNYKQKLWDQLALISDFKLDIDWPVDISKAKVISEKPQPVKHETGTANQMKRDLVQWGHGLCDDEKVASDLANFTDGKIQLDLDHFKFERVDMRALAPTNNGKKRKKK